MPRLKRGMTTREVADRGLSLAKGCLAPAEFSICLHPLGLVWPTVVVFISKHCFHYRSAGWLFSRVTAQVGWHQTVRRERINSSGSCMSVLRIFQLCFLAVESTDRMTTKSSALSWARNPPEIFCRSFIMRASASAWLLVKGTLGSCRNRNTSLLR